MDRLLLLLLSLACVASQDPPSTGCLKEEFSCNDGTCIPDHLLCNGINDCNNGLDEFVCIERGGLGCPPGLMQCGDDPNDCIPLEEWCDGINNCQNGEDESTCAQRPNSSCLISQFECPFLGAILSNASNTECIPRAFQCNGVQDCTSGGDEIACSPPKITVSPVPNLESFHGANPSLLCVAEGTPFPAITWLRDLRPLPTDPRYVVNYAEGTGVLLIRNATVFDEGEYSCIASNSIGTVTADSQTNLRVFNTNPFTCADINANQFNEGSQFFDVQVQTFGDASTAAADVIFVVDESGSMQENHEWIRMVAPLLDNSFKDRGLGVGLRKNLFALVGFGRNMIPEREGVVLTDLTSVEGFLNASQNLVTDGLFEDGYSGIEVALDQVTLREESSRVMIFVSNEARQALVGKEDLTRSVIEQRLINNNFVLNSIVSQGILSDSSDNESFAFALDANGTAYSFASSDEFVKTANGLPHPDSSFTVGSTYQDYSRLALNLGGAVFDVRQIVMGGAILVPFTDAFIDVKVAEVSGVSRRCLNCLCVDPDAECRVEASVPIDNCTGAAPPDPVLTARIFPSEPQVDEGSTLNLTCHISVTPSDADVQIRWLFMGFVDICSGRAECIGNTAIIRNFRREDEGIYICDASTSSQFSSDATLVTFRSPPMATITDAPANGEVIVGKPLMFTCTVTGVPLPSIIWRKSNGDTLNDPSRVFIDTEQQGETLVSELAIDPVQIDDAGDYECVAINSAGSDNDSFTTNVLMRECQLMDGSILEAGDSQVVFFIDETTQTADIVLVVDESGSMATEHRWIINMTRRLDEALQDINIGKTISNRFGVVGFGSFIEDYTNGRIIKYNGESFVKADDIKQLIQMLQVSGRDEDGYLALQFAFDNYEFRLNAAKQFILITDEERDVLDRKLNKTMILNLLEETQLGAVVSEGFESSSGVPAIGMDSFGNAYVYDPLSTTLFRVLGGGQSIPGSAYGTTNQDYTDLALMSMGSVWNLLLLRQGGQVAEAFTEAFVRATVEEIYSRLSRCLNCTCYAATGLTCDTIAEQDFVPECNITRILLSLLPDMSQPPSSLPVSVSPSLQRHLSGLGNAELICTINEGEGMFVWTFNGGQLPSGVVVSSTSNTSVLEIDTVYLEHNGRYSCLARRNGEIGSDTAFVEISELQSPLGIEVMEPELTVSEGQNVSLTCTSNDQVTFEWNFNECFPLPDNAHIENFSQTSILTITNVMLSNQGRYFCVGQRGMPLLSDKDFAKLYVYTPILMISVDPPVSVVADVGSNISLVCSLDCVCPGAILTWRRGFNSTLPNNAFVVFNSDQTEAVLNFRSITPRDCDLYTCIGEFRNQKETVGSHVILREPDDFEVMLNTNSTLYVEAGSNQSLICSSNSEVSEWQWLFNNASDLPSAVEVFDLTNSNRTLLFICGVETIHAGSYQCVGISTNGDIARDASLLQIADSSIDVSSSLLMKSAMSMTTSVKEKSTMDAMPTSVTSVIDMFAVSSSSSISLSSSFLTTSQLLQSTTSTSSFPTSVVGRSLSTTDVISSSTLRESSSSISTRSELVPTSSELGPSSSELGPSSSALVPTSSELGPTSSELGPISSELGPISSELGPTSNVYGPSSSVLDLSSNLLDTSELLGASSTFGPISSELGPSSETGFHTSVVRETMPSPVMTSESIITSTSTDITSINLSSSLATSELLQSTNSTSSFATSEVSQSLSTTDVIHVSTMSPTPLPPLDTPTVSDNELNLLPGEDANVTCISNIPAEMTWSFTASSNLPGNVKFEQINERTAILMVTNFDGDANEGSYQCSATAGTTERGARITITEQEMVKVTVSPEQVTTIPNDSPDPDDELRIECRLDCMCGGYRVDWMPIDGGPLPSGVSTVSMFNSGRELTLVFSVISFESAGDYVCVARSNSQPDMAQKVVSVEVLEPASIRVTPSEISVDPGSDVTLTCVANRDVAQFVWTYTTNDGVTLPNSVTVTTVNSTFSQLVVRNVQNNVNTGQYFCQGLFAQTSEVQSETGNIIAISDLKLTFNPLPQNGQYMFNSGDSILITCRVDCPCTATRAEWREPLPQGLEAAPTSSNNRAEQLRTTRGVVAQPEHSGFYVCRVFNEDGESITEQIEIVVT